jgi:hypothetical protein
MPFPTLCYPNLLLLQTVQLRDQLRKEVVLMLKLTRADRPHPSIVKTIGARTDAIAGGHGGQATVFRVVMEACTRGSLLDRVNRSIRDEAPIPDAEVIRAFGAIASATAYMHAMAPPLAHRDLKLENVLVASDGSYRLCDFGSVCDRSGVISSKEDRIAEEERIERFTTPHFRAPEMLDLYSGLEIDTRVDIWALGCVLFSLAYNKHPFPEAAGVAILSSNYKVPSSPFRPQAMVTLIRSCMSPKPDQRPTASSIVAYCRALFAILRREGSRGDPAKIAAAMPKLVNVRGEDVLKLRPAAMSPADGSSSGSGSGRGGSGAAAATIGSGAAGAGARRRQGRRGQKSSGDLEEQMRKLGLGSGKSKAAGAASGKRRDKAARSAGAGAAAAGKAAAKPIASASGGGDDGFGFDDDDDDAGDDDAGAADDGWGDASATATATGGDDGFGFDDADEDETAPSDAFGFDDSSGPSAEEAASAEAALWGDTPAGAARGRSAPAASTTAGFDGDDDFGFGGPAPAPAAAGVTSSAAADGFDDSFAFDDDAPAPPSPTQRSMHAQAPSSNPFGDEDTPEKEHGDVSDLFSAAPASEAVAVPHTDIDDLFGDQTVSAAAPSRPGAAAEVDLFAAAPVAYGYGGGGGAMVAPLPGPAPQARSAAQLVGADLSSLYGPGAAAPHPAAGRQMPAAARTGGMAHSRGVAQAAAVPRGVSAPAKTGLDALDPFA